MPRGEYEPRSAEASPQEKVKQALQTLEHSVDAILTSESFAAYLQTMSRFHQYSFGNGALIHMQNPDAAGQWLVTRIHTESGLTGRGGMIEKET
jgi:hypothetical protein